MWQYYKELDLGKKHDQLVAPSQQHTRQDFLEAFLADDAEFLGPYPDITQEEADPAAWLEDQRGVNSYSCDEMDEFQQASDRSFAFVKDPIQFWIENKGRWPHVSWMALEIYGIPASEADNERLYSQSADMVTKKRGRLRANTVAAAQCLRQWHQEGIIRWE